MAGVLPSIFRDGLDGASHIPPGLALGGEFLKLSQGDGGEHGAGPGAEILGGEIFAGDFAEVGIHVLGGRMTHRAIGGDVSEEFLARQFLAAAHEFRETGVLHADAGAGIAALAPLNSKVMFPPRTLACRLRRVVRP